MDERLTLLLHPARLRMVHAVRASGDLTTRELCNRLPDLPQATVYRQVERLRRGGVFEVASERKVRGVVERRYRIAPEATAVSIQDARTMNREDHRQAFAAVMAALAAEFDVYLDRPAIDPVDDAVSYRQFVLWLTPKERLRMSKAFAGLVTKGARNGPSKGRDPHLLSTVFFPLLPTNRNQ